MATGKLDLPRYTVSETPSYIDAFNIRVFSAYFKLVEHHPAAIKKTKELEGDSRLSEFEGMMLACGNSASAFDFKRMVAWWLWLANEVGIEKADEHLENFLSNQVVECMLVHWVHGVIPTEIISLTDEIRLVPVSEMPDSAEKEHILRSRWKNDVSVSSNPSAALVTTVFADKLRSQDSTTIDAAISEKYNSLSEISILLNALPGVFCFDGFKTAYNPVHVPYGPLGGSTGGISVGDILPIGKTSSISPESTLEFKRLVEGFGQLSSDWKERVTNSLVRIAQSKSRNNFNDKALDLGIALEMVLLSSSHDNERIPNQLSNHFRLRGAWLLGASYEDRENVSKILSDIYNQRSQVAHNGVLALKKNAHLSTVYGQIEDHISLAERILFKLVSKGPPADWNKLVLGGN